MKITFKAIENDSYEPRKSHIILADGVVMISVREGMEPEDVTFNRDLPSPFKCKKLIELVIEKVKNGEQIEFEEIKVKEED